LLSIDTLKKTRIVNNFSKQVFITTIL